MVVPHEQPLMTRAYLYSGALTLLAYGQLVVVALAVDSKYGSDWTLVWALLLDFAFWVTTPVLVLSTLAERQRTTRASYLNAKPSRTALESGSLGGVLLLVAIILEIAKLLVYTVFWVSTVWTITSSLCELTAQCSGREDLPGPVRWQWLYIVLARVVALVLLILTNQLLGEKFRYIFSDAYYDFAYDALPVTRTRTGSLAADYVDGTELSSDEQQTSDEPPRSRAPTNDTGFPDFSPKTPSGRGSLRAIDLGPGRSNDEESPYSVMPVQFSIRRHRAVSQYLF